MHVCGPVVDFRLMKSTRASIVVGAWCSIGVCSALLFLATKERRNELAMRLLLLLPGYVRQGRHLDALMIEFCAQMTAEETEAPNPFLGCMFLYGLEAWGAQQDASRKTVLEEAGFHLGPDANPEEIERWLDKEMADPESAARWQRLCTRSPN